MVVGCIYKIENLINNKVYIGQTKQKVNYRYSQHFSRLRNNNHQNNYLQNSFNKYGEENFKFEVVCECESLDELNEKEAYYIEEFSSMDSNNGYNLQSGGKNYSHSSISKQKMSKNNALFWLGKKRPQHSVRLNKNNPSKKISVRKKQSVSHHGGLFGFVGGYYSEKKTKPWNRVWFCRISYCGNINKLGYYNDPLSCEIVYKIVFNEIYGDE